MSAFALWSSGNWEVAAKLETWATGLEEFWIDMNALVWFSTEISPEPNKSKRQKPHNVKAEKAEIQIPQDK